LPRSKFDVDVVLLTRDGPLSDRLRVAQIPVTVIGKRFKADPTALQRLRRFLQQRKPDIVHTWLFAANSFGRAAARMANIPVIIASERCVDPWKRGWHFWIDRRLARLTDAITTNSTAVQDFYASHGIDRELFRIIPNGVPPADMTPIDRGEACRRLNVKPERKLILAVGRLWPQKGYRDMIWAGELLGTLREDTSVVIIGDGPQAGELLRHRDAVTVPERVQFAGVRGDIAELLPHADIFWNFSAYEGQSNSILEAMQAGVPVVASNIAGTRDLIVHDVCGKLVEPGDSADLARQTNVLLDAPETAQRLGQAAKQRVADQFSVAAMVNKHAELYQQLLEPR